MGLRTGMQGERADGHVAALLRLNQVADCLNLGVRPPLGHGARAARAVVEGAGLLAPNPRVVASCREMKDSERSGQRQYLPRTLDRSEQQSFPSLVRHAAVSERESRDPEQGQNEPEDRDEHGGPVLQLEDASATCGFDFALGVERHDVPNATSDLSAVERGISSSGSRSGFLVRTICSLTRWS